MPKSKIKNSNKSMPKLYKYFIVTFVSLSMLISVDFQVDIKFRIEKTLTPHATNGQHTVQDYSFRVNAIGNTKLHLVKVTK
jgi:hypothetical protein